MHRSVFAGLLALAGTLAAPVPPGSGSARAQAGEPAEGPVQEQTQRPAQGRVLPASPQPDPGTAAPPQAGFPTDPAARLVAALDPALQELAAEVLERNPELARARRESAAAELRAPQVSALPDPVASLTAFLVSPETRVGPQRLAASLSQRLPWFGTLALREQAALHGAAAARAAAEAQAVSLVTETRRLYYELAFLAAEEEAVRADLATLEHYETLARARYGSGVGLEQTVVKVQAEITRDESRLLEIAARRATLEANLNALRDAPQSAPLPSTALPQEPPVPEIGLAELERRALAARPEVARARARIAEAEARAKLAGKEYFPDVTLGLTYTAVDERDDAAARLMPPEGDGDDVVGLRVGVTLPVWRRKLEAGVEEAAARELAAQEGLRAVTADVVETLGELAHRIPLAAEQYELFERVLTVQAEEALRSAEAAYSAGTLGALDLLDAERVLLEVRIATARTLADLAIAVARLEGAVAVPLETSDTNPDTDGGDPPGTAAGADPPPESRRSTEDGPLATETPS